MSNKVVCTAEAAAHVGLSPSTLEKRRLNGNGPVFLKLGRSVRYRLSDLDAWIGDRVVHSTSAYSSLQGQGRLA